MSDAKRKIDEYISSVEKIIIELSVNEEHAIAMLNETKAAMEKQESVEKEYKELFDACIYNALATINTAPNQKKNNSQLVEALVDAKEEMKIIGEML